MTGVTVSSRPEGLELDLRGYRFLLRGVYSARVGEVNVGDGVLYRVNDHEILLRTGGREVLLDGAAIDVEPEEIYEILAPAVKEAIAPSDAPTGEPSTDEPTEEQPRSPTSPESPNENPSRPDVSEKDPAGRP